MRSLHHIPLEVYEIVFVAKRLSLHFTCTSLNLCGCAVTAEATEFLADAVKEHRTLTDLRVDNNLMADGGAITMGKALRENKRLRKLNIAHNAIGDHGLGKLSTTRARTHSDSYECVTTSLRV